MDVTCSVFLTSCCYICLILKSVFYLKRLQNTSDRHIVAIDLSFIKIKREYNLFACKVWADVEMYIDVGVKCARGEQRPEDCPSPRLTGRMQLYYFFVLSICKQITI